MNIVEVVKEEAQKLVENLDAQITDPAQRAAVLRMSTDLAMLPIRMAQGEDVSLLFQSLQAEASLRGVATSLKAQAAAQQAWMNIIIKIIAAAISAV